MEPFQSAKVAQVKGMHDPKVPPLLGLMDTLVRLASAMDDEEDFEILDDVPQFDDQRQSEDGEQEFYPEIDGKEMSDMVSTGWWLISCALVGSHTTVEVVSEAIDELASTDPSLTVADIG